MRGVITQKRTALNRGRTSRSNQERKTFRRANEHRNYFETVDQLRVGYPWRGVRHYRCCRGTQRTRLRTRRETLIRAEMELRSQQYNAENYSQKGNFLRVSRHVPI
jgi:hypothetical protein